MDRSSRENIKNERVKNVWFIDYYKIVIFKMFCSLFYYLMNFNTYYLNLDNSILLEIFVNGSQKNKVQ